MRSSCIKQIQSLGVVLPFDLKLSQPLKIIPVVFFNSKSGVHCKDFLFKRELPVDTTDDFLLNFCSDACICDPVFVKREYDGSEVYYLVCDFTFNQINIISKYLKDRKGGILL